MNTRGGGENTLDTQSGGRKKAEPVNSACNSCRSKKTKCSGERPICASCRAKELQCSWDVANGLTRTRALKQRLIAAEHELASLQQQLLEANQKLTKVHAILAVLQHGSDQAATMLLARLRLGDSVDDLAVNS